MRVFKYRKYDPLHLDSLETNSFWAPNYKELNDPFETLVLKENLKNQIKIFSSILNEKKGKELNEEQFFVEYESMIAEVGIYALASSPINELLWAHYGDSHHGFCIEYDFQILCKENIYHNLYDFQIIYSDQPPDIQISDFINKDTKLLLQKFAGTKSKAWSYEGEVRVLTDKKGKHYYDYSAVKAIHFGNRMSEDAKHEIMRRLCGRDISYTQIEISKNSYTLFHQPKDDVFKAGHSYLYTVPSFNKKYEILSKEYNKILKKGNARLLLYSKLDSLELENVANDIKNKLFLPAERLYIFYYFPYMNPNDFAWARSVFEKGMLTNEVMGLNYEEERVLQEMLDKDRREIVGQWIDDTIGAKCAITIRHDGNETVADYKYVDGSSFQKAKTIIHTSQGVRYDDVEENPHGEYIIIDKNGCFGYYGQNGLIRKLKLYKFISNPKEL